MSPKSRGRPAGRGKAKQQRRGSARELHPAELVLRDASRVIARLGTALDAERWVSEWLGRAWLAAPLGEREPERLLCMGIVGRACTGPSAHGAVAVAALRRVMPQAEKAMLDGTLAILRQTQSLPEWADAPGWTPVRAWRAVDVWESERVLFIDYDGPVPHTLMAQIGTVGGILVDTLGVLKSDAALAWAERREPGSVPMPLTEQPVDEALAELGDALRTTDMTWPRQDDPDYVAIRAVAWSRCRAHLPSLVESSRESIADEQRQDLVVEFLAAADQADVTDEAVTRSLAELFLDYGDGHIIAGPLCWSPGTVALFLADWLPRKAVLSAQQRAGLPSALRRWLRFVLERRGLDAEWTAPVVAAVDEWSSAFEDAFDEESSWGPAKRIAAELAGRGVDLADREQVGRAVAELNAERLARTMLDE